MFVGYFGLIPGSYTQFQAYRDTWTRALSPFAQADREGFWESGPACLLERRTFNAAANRDERLPLVCPDSGTALAFWGRLDNRSQLAMELDIHRFHLIGMTDGQLVFAGWRRWGQELPEHLLGDFALAVMDMGRRQVFLARDPMGVKPLYYQLDKRALVFATSVAILRGFQEMARTPDPEWMARYLIDLMKNNEQTGYREVRKLPGGHCLTVMQDGHVQLRRWHHWRDDSPPASRRDGQWVDAYRAVLEESIRCRMDSDYPLGTENSGGIDSATVTAYLARLLGIPGDRLHSFSFALLEHEPAHILETSRARRIAHNYIITGPTASGSGDETLDGALRVLGYPREHESSQSHTPFYRECSLRGIRTLFSGFGGDEVVTNQGHHLRWELLDQGQHVNLWEILPGNAILRSLRLAKTMLLKRRKPAWNAGLLAGYRAFWSHQFLTQEVINELGLEAEYLESARYDAPYRRINDFILKGLLEMPYVSSRLETCTLMAASFGVDYRWPLWDVRLVQQYLSTPSIQKVGPGGVGRYLHRCAIVGVVPEEVVWKPTKDMGAPPSALITKPADPQAFAKRAIEIAADLHPALEAVVDREKLRRQIDQAAAGRSDVAFSRGLRLGIGRLRWIDRWLKVG